MKGSVTSLFLGLFTCVFSVSVFSQAQSASKLNTTAGAEFPEVNSGIDVLEESNFEALTQIPRFQGRWDW